MTVFIGKPDWPPVIGNYIAKPGKYGQTSFMTLKFSFSFVHFTASNFSCCKLVSYLHGAWLLLNEYLSETFCNWWSSNPS